MDTIHDEVFGLYCDEHICDSSPLSPFSPNEQYPEYAFDDAMPNNDNLVYEGFRQLLKMMQLDIKNYSSETWNPFGTFISPGDTVLIKPNLVMDVNPKHYGTDCLYTSPALIRAVIDYAWIALRGKGKIILADAPMQSCDFNNLCQTSGLGSMVTWLKANKVNIELCDLRDLVSVDTKAGLRQVVKREGTGTIIDLGCSSQFGDLSENQLNKLRITNYDPSELIKHHNALHHEYCISDIVLDANVIINMPKFKTHRKAGITGALKNLIGINARKEYLPHHIKGSKTIGSDEYAQSGMLQSIASDIVDKRNKKLQQSKSNRIQVASAQITEVLFRLARILQKIQSKKIYEEGSWYGNDTIWRTILDINKIALYADCHGLIRDAQQRKMIVVGDGIIAGEGEGPLLPSPKHLGIMTFATSSIAHDIAQARIMGTDHTLIPTVKHAYENFADYSNSTKDPGSIKCISNNHHYNEHILLELPTTETGAFIPTKGWERVFLRPN